MDLGGQYRSALLPDEHLRSVPVEDVLSIRYLILVGFYELESSFLIQDVKDRPGTRTHTVYFGPPLCGWKFVTEIVYGPRSCKSLETVTSSQAG